MLRRMYLLGQLICLSLLPVCGHASSFVDCFKVVKYGEFRHIECTVNGLTSLDLSVDKWQTNDWQVIDHSGGVATGLACVRIGDSVSGAAYSGQYKPVTGNGKSFLFAFQAEFTGVGGAQKYHGWVFLANDNGELVIIGSEMDQRENDLRAGASRSLIAEKNSTVIDMSGLLEGTGSGWACSSSVLKLQGLGPFLLTGDASEAKLRVEVAATAFVTISNLTLSASTSPIFVDEGCHLNLYLAGTNTLTTTGCTAALEVEGSASVSITNASNESAGKLTANGGDYSACIGCSDFGDADGGTVVILGGVIVAGGAEGKASGIGGGGSDGKVVICGGEISSGCIGPGYNVKGGVVEILGGKIDAVGCWGASAIGGTDSDVFISGGWIKAVSGGISGGIGGGYRGPATSVTISGGTIVSSGEKYDVFSKRIAVSGGSVNVKAFSISPTNEAGTALRLYEVSGTEPNVSVTLAGTYPKNYGQNDLYTDDSARLYLWMPSDYEPTIATPLPMYLASDGTPDTNLDGVPDVYVTKYSLADSIDGPGIGSYNTDEDYFPQKANPYSSLIPSLPTIGLDPFTAKLEIRGYGDALNDAPALVGIVDVVPNRVYTDPALDSNSTLSPLEYMAWTDYTNEHPTATVDDWSPERPSDPTKTDTDGDGIDDGTEYWWWYRAHVGYLDADGNHCYATGRRYSVSMWPNGETITSSKIKAMMDPIDPIDASSSDSDGDGLPDLLEIEIGTNPFDFDTDGDGLPDGYEIHATGTDPLQFCTASAGQDQDCIRMDSVICWCDGGEHGIPVYNPTELPLFWSTAQDGTFSEIQPKYSEPGVYTNWCYAAITPAVASASRNYPELVVRGGVHMATITIGPLADGQHIVELSGRAWYITVSGGNAVVDQCVGATGGELIIPSELGGCSVVGIADRAFYFSSYSSVTFPGSLREIGEWSFAGSQIVSLIIPEGVEKIGSGAFSGCHNLSSLSLPSTLEYIGYAAFGSCPALPTVMIPASVCEIGEQAFGGNRSMKSIHVNEDNPCYSSVNGLLMNKECTRLLGVPAGLSVVEVPDTVVEIGDAAFYFCDCISTVALTPSVRRIGNGAFAGCHSLSSIQIPDGVESIGCNAFQLCQSLYYICLPASVSSVDGSSFGGCASLMDIDVDEGNISYRSIDGVLCDDIGERLVAWPRGRAEVSFPEHVTAIAPNAFGGCDAIVDLTIPNQIKTIESYAFSGCTNLRVVRICDGVVRIGDDAFSSCYSLERVTLPKSLQYFGRQMFFLCRNLYEVKFCGNCPAYVGDEIYRDTPSELTTYVSSTSTGWGTSEFPSTWRDRPIVSYPGDGYYSETVDGYTWYFTVTDGMVEIGRRDANGVPVDAPAVEPFPNGDLNVPEVLFECPVVSLGSHALARCYDLVTVYLPDVVTNIGASAFADCERLEYVYMPSELKSIGQYAFGGCSMLPDAYIPWGVETIASAAYADCSNLGYVYIGECLRDVGSAVFANCPSLGAIDVDGANPCFASYDGMLFDANLTQLFACPCGKSTAELPSTLSVISDAAFIDCGQLTELFIPADVSTIGSQAFSRCDSLLSVTFDGDCPEDAATTMFLDSPEALVVIAYKDSKGWPQTGTWCGRTLELRRRDGMCEIVFDPCGGTVCETSRLVTQGTPIGELPVAILDGRVFEGWRNENGALVDSAMVVQSDVVLSASWLSEMHTSNGTLRYRMIGGVVSLVQGLDATGDWALPAKIGDADIVMIEDACFAYSTNLVSVSIPDSVTNIGAYAFYDCRHLQNVDFGNGLVKIDSGAFARCVELDCIAMPSSLRALGNKVERCRHDIGEQQVYSSSYMTNFIDSVGSTVCYTNFSRGANRAAWALGVFEGCTSLSDVSLNDGLLVVGAGAFKDCSSLYKLSIPETVNTVGGQVEYWYESNSSNYSYSATQPLTWECPNGDESTSANTSTGCAYMDSGFAEGCVGLEEINLPTRLEYLGPFSFFGCEMLTYVNLPSTLKTLYQGTFSGCSWLSSVVLPEDLELIGGVEPMPNWWQSDYADTHVYFGQYYSNTSHWQSANSTVLNFVDGKWVCVDRSVNNGQPSVIVNTYDITDNRWMPNVDELIIPYNTNDWAWIERRLYSSSIARGMGLMFSDEERIALMRERHRFHPADATYNFGNQYSDFKPTAGVFSGCYSLENIDLPASVRRIGDYTFYDCCNLLELEIPNGLAVLGFEAFGGECSVMSISIPWLNFGDLWEVFPSHAYMTNVRITSGPTKIVELDEYLNDALSREYSYYEHEYLPESVKYELIRRYFSECWVFDYPILAGFASLESLTLPNGLKSFDWSMGWYETPNLTTIAFPDTLRELGSRAFCEFRGGRVVLPPTIEKIGNYAFGYSQVTNLIFLGNAPKDVSPTLFASEDEWTREFDAALTVYVYPGTTGWDAVKKTDGLPANGLWPTTAALFRRRPITYIEQPIEEGGVFAFRDEASEKMVSVPQEWLAEYGLLQTTDRGAASVATLSPISSRSLYQSYVAGLDPTDEEDKFTAKIEIVDGEVKVSWEPELSPEKAALRKYTTYGCENIGGNWQDMSTVPEANKSNYRFFKVTVEMP